MAIDYQKITDASKALDEAVKQIETAAYRRGWDDAVGAIIRSASSMTGAPGATPPSTPQRRARRGSGVKAVLSAVRDKPGMTGVEVVQAVRATEPNAKERTIRTSLRRLKMDGSIKQRDDGRWYPLDDLEELERLLP